MAFSSYDRFAHKLDHVDRLTHKGREHQSQQSGSAPYYQDSTQTTPSKADLQRGLSELGIKISPQQLDKLRSMGGSEVLKSIVTLGGSSNTTTAASDTRGGGGGGGGGQKQHQHSKPTNHTGQTDHKNSESVHGLLRMPDQEAKRIVASGDDRRDTDRVVTGLQSDRHRHYERQQMGRKKTELHALRSLKACGPDPASVFKKLLRRDARGTGTTTSNGASVGDSKQSEVLSKHALRKGLNELAGVQLSPADLDAVVRKLDPQGSGHNGITLRQFSQILSKIPDNHKPKTSRQERQHHKDLVNLTNTRSTDPTQVSKGKTARAIAAIDAKVSKRFGTEPDRLRRLYMAMDSNGDGTISTTSLQKGLAQLGMGVSQNEFSELIHTVRAIQSNVNAPSSGDDIYFSDLVHAFEHEVTSTSHNDQSLDFTNDHPLPNKKRAVSKKGYVHDAHTGLPSHQVHVDDNHHRLNPFDEIPQGKDKSTFRWVLALPPCVCAMFETFDSHFCFFLFSFYFQQFYQNCLCFF